jgi:hypothetical protein
MDHETVLVTVGNESANIDKNIAPLIEGLWKLNIDTLLSCENNNGKVWIDFTSVYDAENFLNIVAKYSEGLNSMYNRIRNEWSDPNNPTKNIWEYDPHIMDLGVHQEITKDDFVDETFSGKHEFHFTMSVRFPQKDLKSVTNRILNFKPKK